MTTLHILLGLVLLVAGGDLLVRGGTSLARRLGVSNLMIGLTLVGFGTSTPELITSLDAAFAGSPGIAVGNVVGSNTANILLILGLAALVHPIATPPTMMRRDGTAVLVAAVACLVVVLMGELERWVGVVLVAVLIAYVGFTYLREHTGSTAELPSPDGLPIDNPHSAPLALALALIGLVLSFFGAHLLVTGAISLAATLGISETIVGLTVVAVGTSLPELAASLVAAARRQSDIAIGNILGSNIYNVLGILGVTAIVKPIPVPDVIARLDIWVMLAATVAMLVFARTGRCLSRREGAVFVLAYAGYVGYLATHLGTS
ncbi:MAG: calcium/sodium antiporter [Pseudomonadales bacterium]